MDEKIMQYYDLNRVRSTLYRHEGKLLLANGNHKMYRCSEGYWTIGTGWNLEANGLPPDLAERLLDISIAQAVKDVDALAKSFRVDWRSFTSRRQETLLNMAFQMGRDGLGGFKLMWAALALNNYHEASVQMLDSAWARSQTPGRAKEMAAWMKAG